jgi:hypothetical protein
MPSFDIRLMCGVGYEWNSFLLCTVVWSEKHCTSRCQTFVITAAGTKEADTTDPLNGTRQPRRRREVGTYILHAHCTLQMDTLSAQSPGCSRTNRRKNSEREITTNCRSEDGISCTAILLGRDGATTSSQGGIMHRQSSHTARRSSLHHDYQGRIIVQA